MRRRPSSVWTGSFGPSDQALAEIAIPALGAAEREGVETVVDEADPHMEERRRFAGESLRWPRDRKRATFAAFARS
jgi:hypothetical protein